MDIANLPIACLSEEVLSSLNVPHVRMSHPNIDSRIAGRRQTVLSLFSLLATKRAGSGVIPSATHGDSPVPHPALAYRGLQQKLEITSHSVPR